MKIKTTRRFIKDHANLPIVSAGYCSLQTLLRYHSPTAYTAGIYGWNCDVYELEGLTITTGYRGMVGPTAKGIEEFEKRAQAWLKDHTTYDEAKDGIETLLNDFIELQRQTY